MSKELRHQFLCRMCIFVFGLDNVDTLTDQDTAHGRNRFTNHILFRPRHLANDIRISTVSRAQLRLYALNLRAVGVKIRALLGAQTDAEILPRRNDARNIVPVALKLTLRDKERTAHPLPLHLAQNFLQRLLFGESAKGKYDGGLHRCNESLCVCNPPRIFRTQRCIVPCFRLPDRDTQIEDAEYANQRAKYIPAAHKSPPFLSIGRAAVLCPHFPPAAICSRTQCRDWRQA